MPSGDQPEVAFPIEDLLTRFTESFTAAAIRLRTTMQGEDWVKVPYVYHMPSMSLEIRLALTYSENKVKGFFTKTSASNEQQVTSVIKIDLVSVPNAKSSGET
jgi:hypothetical protein